MILKLIIFTYLAIHAFAIRDIFSTGSENAAAEYYDLHASVNMIRPSFIFKINPIVIDGSFNASLYSGLQNQSLSSELSVNL